MLPLKVVPAGKETMWETGLNTINSLRAIILEVELSEPY